MPAMSIRWPVTIPGMKESDLLAWLYKSAWRSRTVPIPIGDDMAGVRLSDRTGGNRLVLLKIDQCLDRVHFDMRDHMPRQIGCKAVNRCLSDCAAMAAKPKAILLSVALPTQVSLTWAKTLFQGCRAAAQKAACPIVGGDTAVWNQRLAITVAALGLPATDSVLRSGARPGDALCVSGRLGGSILGRHLTFRPRIRLAHRLVQLAPIHAMMDISDGLAIDLPRLLSMSRVGAQIDARQVPIHPDARRLSRRDGLTPLHHALCDGEDYELLFTLPQSDADRLRAARFPITNIGQITRRRNEIVLLRNGQPQPWPVGGWNHGVKVSPSKRISSVAAEAKD